MPSRSLKNELGLGLGFFFFLIVKEKEFECYEIKDGVGKKILIPQKLKQKQYMYYSLKKETLKIIPNEAKSKILNIKTFLIM